MRAQTVLTSTLLSANALAQTTTLPGSRTYGAPADFPSSLFPSYYYFPTTPTQEPQPVIYDPVLEITFPYNLTNPITIPSQDPDPVFYPEPIGNMSDSDAREFVKQVSANVSAVINSNSITDKCTKCLNALAAAKPAALYAPSFVPDAMVSLCEAYQFKSNASCQLGYTGSTFGAVWTQVLRYADVEGLDGQYICSSIGGFCNSPKTRPLDTTGLFPKPKPTNAHAPKASGKRVKVAHLSDFHLDARYHAGSEANCTTGLCCRTNGYNSNSPNQTLLPAPLLGWFKCDTPYFLGVAALQAVGPLTGTGKGIDEEPLGWSIYTGDLVAHDPQNQLSRAFAEYTETSVYHMFKHYVTGPVFAALGNHDSNPENIDAPYSLPGPLGQQQSWNYDHVAGLWVHEGWISEEDAKQARTHYGGYSIKNHFGLRIIAFNTDFWYTSNIFNFINTTNPDNSGIFSWMISELQKAEDEGERVWIIGHVLSGWDGSDPIPDPTNLFYQIVDRYSPHVIANVFFGHSHEDHIMLYYANNGTVQNAGTALTTGWIGPSVTPLTNLNSGFRLYEVDTGDFNIYEAYTFYSNVSTFSSVNGGAATFSFEYSTRDAYGPAAGWDAGDPLNATFWHKVTEAMENDMSLVGLQNTYQGKMSLKSPKCTSEACQKAKICYMRSGSVAIGSQCPRGYVLDPFLWF
ncbi:Ser/Thr protein phosphatase family protein [Amanita muscaria]